MTIIVGITSPDGIVPASDSRTTTTDEQDRHRILSDSALKVFSIADRFGVATSGMAQLGSETIEGLMDRFLAQLEAEQLDDVGTFADALGAFFTHRFDEWLTALGEAPWAV